MHPKDRMRDCRALGAWEEESHDSEEWAREYGLRDTLSEPSAMGNAR